MHNVTLITRYLDGAQAEHSQTYQVEHGGTFLEHFRVMDGYDLYNFNLRSQPVYDVDMDEKTVSLSPVEQDHVIELEFDKTEYKVILTTQYSDGSLPDTAFTDWIRYEEGYSRTYEIADGYRVANPDQLPDGVTIDETANTVTISSVTRDYTINLVFEKKLFIVSIRIVYEDGSREDQVSSYEVLNGSWFETGFTIEQGYGIKKVNFNALGISVNRSRQTVTINQVLSPVEITITVR